MISCSWFARLGRGAAAFGLLSYAHAAVAQVPADPAPTARELFDQGRALLQSKDYANACPKFEESQRLDPGGGTLLNLALCNELLGKTATAWAEFDEGRRVAQHDNRPDRIELAEQHIATLSPKLSRIRIAVPTEARVAGLTIKRNGVELAEANWGEAVPVDPGTQLFEVVAPGKVATQFTIVVSANGDTEEVRVEPLEDEAVPIGLIAPTARPSASASIVPRSSPMKTEAGHISSRASLRWAGGTVAGTGVVALGVATYLSIRAIELQHDANRDCPSVTQCDASGILESRSAARYANAGTIVDIGGAVLIGVGAYLFRTAPRGRRVNASIGFGPSEATARVLGEF